METAWGLRCSSSDGVGETWERREGCMGATRELREGDVRAGCCSVGAAWEQCGGGVGAA